MASVKITEMHVFIKHPYCVKYMLAENSSFFYKKSIPTLCSYMRTMVRQKLESVEIQIDTMLINIYIYCWRSSSSRSQPQKLSQIFISPAESLQILSNGLEWYVTYSFISIYWNLSLQQTIPKVRQQYHSSLRSLRKIPHIYTPMATKDPSVPRDILVLPRSLKLALIPLSYLTPLRSTNIEDEPTAEHLPGAISVRLS